MSAHSLSNALDHMFDAARQACEFVEGLDKEDFLGDKRTQQAVILNLIIVGEAASKILANHSDFVEQHSEIPWSGMKGMRNRIAHGYHEISLETVWETVVSELPELVAKLMVIQAL